MKSVAICERCNILTSLSHLFSCNHSLCTKCLLRIIAFRHIKSIATENQIQITCPCNFGYMNLKVADIPQIFGNLKAQSSSKINSEPKKLHCLKCEVWLCDECIEIHDVLNSQPQPAQDRTSVRKCNIHKGQLKEYYCHNCQKIICILCVERKGAEHYNHNYQLIKDYDKKLRAEILLCDVEAQMSRIEEIREEFKKHVDSVRRNTLDLLNDIICTLDCFQSTYIYKMNENMQKANIILDLLKSCYLDFNSLKNNTTVVDIHLLKDISTWNRDLPKLEIQNKTEMTLKKFREDFVGRFKYKTVEEIDFGWNLYIWSKQTLTLKDHQDNVSSIIQMKDGRIATGSWDKKIKIWKEKCKEYKNTLTLEGHNDCINSLIQLEDERLASGSFDRTIKIWKVKKKEYKNTLTLTGHHGSLFTLLQLKDGRIASGSNENIIKIWEVKENEFLNTLTLTGHNGDVNWLIQMNDRRIVSASTDRTIKIWEMELYNNFKNTLTLIGHDGPVLSVLELKDRRIASSSCDNTIKIWEVKENQVKITLTLLGHSNWAWPLAILKDGSFVSGSRDTTIKIWVEREHVFKNIVTLIGHYHAVRSVIQLKDGRIASGGDDNNIKIWE